MIDQWGGAQWVLICLMAFGLILSMKDHGEMKRQSAATQLIANVLLATILWWGGFWS